MYERLCCSLFVSLWMVVCVGTFPQRRTMSTTVSGNHWTYEVSRAHALSTANFRKCSPPGLSWPTRSTRIYLFPNICR